MMKEVWNARGGEGFGVYASAGDGDMMLVTVRDSIQDARIFVRDNWVDGEGLYVEIVDHGTGEILCYFEDEEDNPVEEQDEPIGITIDASDLPMDEIAELIDLLFGGMGYDS